MAEVSQPTIEQDIASLERQLEEKKAALGHEKSEKEILHETVGEKIQQHAPSYVPKLPTSAGPTPQQTEPPSYLSQEHKDKIQEIINMVFEKNLEEGIKEVVKSGNPALIDAFHDMLTDELYNQLIVRKKLDKVV